MSKEQRATSPEAVYCLPSCIGLTDDAQIVDSAFDEQQTHNNNNQALIFAHLQRNSFSILSFSLF